MPNSFQPSDYYDVANKLVSESPDEACFRAAVSRTYYAVFLMVRDKARLVGGDDVHARAKKAVSAKSFTEGSRFQELREMRTHADYVLKPGDEKYKSDYDDWPENWKTAVDCYEKITPVIGRW